jgi:hypothetical protein
MTTKIKPTPLRKRLLIAAAAVWGRFYRDGKFHGSPESSPDNEKASAVGHIDGNMLTDLSLAKASDSAVETNAVKEVELKKAEEAFQFVMRKHAIRKNSEELAKAAFDAENPWFRFRNQLGAWEYRRSKVVERSGPLAAERWEKQNPKPVQQVGGYKPTLLVVEESPFTPEREKELERQWAALQNECSFCQGHGWNGDFTKRNNPKQVTCKACNGTGQTPPCKP